MKWLAIALVGLVVALVAFPATVGAVGALIGHHAENAQAINYISHKIHVMDADRRRAAFRRKLDRLTQRQQF